MAITLTNVILAVILGTLAAIIYSLRNLTAMEKKLIRMDRNLQSMVAKALKRKKTSKSTKKRR